MFKRILPILFTTLCLTSCVSNTSSNPNNIKLATLSQAKEYAEKFTKGTPYYEDEQNGGSEVHYVFTDKEKDFSYTVTSYACALPNTVDFSDIKYIEAKTTDFGECYEEKAVEELSDDLAQICAEYNAEPVEISVTQYHELYAVTITDTNNAEIIAETIGKLFDDYDDRQYWDSEKSNYAILVYDTNETLLGYYSPHEKYYTI